MRAERRTPQEVATMFRAWAENRMYGNTMRLAVQALREAARTANALDKLRLLDFAEQKLRDANWLRPEVGKEQRELGLEEIARNRQATLRQQAMPAAGRLLEAAEKGVAEKRELLRAAGELLAFLYHYLPEEAETQALGARFRSLGGEQPAYRPIPALADKYHRPEGGVGCGAMIGGLLATAMLCAWALGLLR